MQYDKILLDDEEQRIFNKFKHRNTAILTKHEFQILREKGLVTDAIGGKSDWFNDLPSTGICKLSVLGKDLRLYQKNQKRLMKKDNRRYRINTALSVTALIIATASLIVSILALMK